MYRSCQDVVDGPVDQRRKGYVGGSAYVIDPDGPGDVRPFRVTCNLDYPNGNGVTVVRHHNQHIILGPKRYVWLGYMHKKIGVGSVTGNPYQTFFFLGLKM